MFAAVTTLYTVVGIQLEERDLESMHPEYRIYRHKVPALVPSLRRRLTQHERLDTA